METEQFDAVAMVNKLRQMRHDHDRARAKGLDGRANFLLVRMELLGDRILSQSDALGDHASTVIELLKPDWTTYPGALASLSPSEYQRAVALAREWLYDNDLGEEIEVWKVWNLLNANYLGGVAAFVEDTQQSWT